MTSVLISGEPERWQHAHVIHFEIVGKDQKALQSYYADLFGWKLNTSNPGGYGMTDPAATGVIVGVGATPTGQPATSPVTSRSTTSTRRWPRPSAWAAR